MNEQQLLLSNWQIAYGPAQHEFTTRPEMHWRSAIVPGIASQSLHELAEQIDEHEIWYRCPWPDASPARYLISEGLAGLVEVYADQQLLFCSSSMFLTHQLCLPEFSTPPRYLYLRCRALQTMLRDQKPRPRWKTRLVSQQGWRWQRQSLLGRMPGWSSSHAPVGPYRAIRLIAADTLTLLEWQADCQLQGAQGLVRFQARLALPALAPADVASNWRFNLHSEARHSELQAELLERGSGYELQLRGELRWDKVALWWPHTHGQPNRYPLRLELQIHGQSRWSHDLGHCAFRHLSWQNPAGFAITINQQTVFCRGVCWTPLAGLSDDPEALRAMLVLLRDAGMNLLRVPGTMLYESRNFYALCDELGIMVWQDCVLANLDYPLQEPAFANQLKHEVTAFLQARRHFACLVMLCGNSEIEQQAAMLGVARNQWRHDFFQTDLPGLIESLALNCYYTPSSPATLTGPAWPFQINAGISHYFGVGAYLRPLTDARCAELQFTSECLGFANLPDEHFLEQHFQSEQICSSHPLWKRGIPRDQACHWDFEDVRDFYLQQIFQVQPAPLRSSHNYRYRQLSRLSSGIAMAHCLQEWRRQASPCQGALIWFWRDLVPGAGWGLIDASGQPKAAYYFVKRVLQAQAVLLSDEGLNGLQCQLVNDRASELRATLVFTIWQTQEQILHQSEHRLTLAPHSQHNLNDAELCQQFMDISYAYRFGPAQHQAVQAALYTVQAEPQLISQAVFLPEGWSKLPQQTAAHWQLQLSALPHHPQEWQLTLQCDQIALAVALEIPGYLVDDNYFDLFPGQVRQLRLCAISDAARTSNAYPRGQLLALNARHSVRLPEAQMKLESV